MHSTELYFFDAAHLEALANAHCKEYAHARPFPHCVLDNFLPEKVATCLAGEFPQRNFKNFALNENRYQWKKQSGLQETNFEGVSHSIRHILNEFNGKVFLDFLQRLTGIEGLVADPHFAGAALHQILRGGRLAVHADFNWDSRRKLDRRINVLLFLNPNWLETWGGDLQLWDSRMSRCEASIYPVLNRCVIFNTDSTSYHGHPDRLRCPEDRTRNSMAFYYYTNGRPGEGKSDPHSTLWKPRPRERFPNKWVVSVKRAVHFIGDLVFKGRLLAPMNTNRSTSKP